MEPSNYQNAPFSPKNLIHDSSSPPSNQFAPQEKKHEEWSWEENKVFENALAEIGIESEILLPTLALRIPTKSISQFKEHFKALVDDIRMIESDFDEIPNIGVFEKNNSNTSQVKIEGPKRGETRSTNGRKRGAPWTKTEHELFLLGLEQYGKGDWKSISRYVVLTRTPAQVASHAQKYFLKLQNPNSRRKNGSVMRTVEDSWSAKNAETVCGDQITSGSSRAVILASMHC